MNKSSKKPKVDPADYKLEQILGDKDNVRFTDFTARNTFNSSILKMSFEKGISNLERQIKKLT